MSPPVSGLRRRLLRPVLLVSGVAAVVLLVAWHLALRAPPRRVVLAAGPSSGVYFAVAQRYAAHFEAAGLALEVRETAGSRENYALLADRHSGVDVAIVQGGTAPAERRGLVALASLFLEPVWLFHKGGPRVQLPSDLAGARIAVGPEGSGVRPLALELLAAAGVTGPGRGTTLVDLGGAEAAAALRTGTVDAVVLVLAPTAPLLKELLATPGVALMDFLQAPAYARRFPYLSPVTLHRGAMDLARDLPDREVHLVAPAAVLVARESVHPAVVELLTEAALHAHREGDLLSEPGTFPSTAHTALPVSEQARHFLSRGPGLLRQVLPFWVAALVDRVWLLLVPLVVVLLPLLRVAPTLYRWGVRSRLIRWYAQLREVDERLRDGPAPHQALADLQLLERLEHEVVSARVPLSSADEVYDLRMHLGYLRGRLEQLLARGAPPDVPVERQHG